MHGRITSFSVDQKLSSQEPAQRAMRRAKNGVEPIFPAASGKQDRAVRIAAKIGSTPFLLGREIGAAASTGRKREDGVGRPESGCDAVRNPGQRVAVDSGVHRTGIRVRRTARRPANGLLYKTCRRSKLRQHGSRRKQPRWWQYHCQRAESNRETCVFPIGGFGGLFEIPESNRQPYD